MFWALHPSPTLSSFPEPFFPSPPLLQVRALSPVSLLRIDRGHFNALMGPLLDAMIQRAEEYLQLADKTGKDSAGGFRRLLRGQVC